MDDDTKPKPRVAKTIDEVLAIVEREPLPTAADVPYSPVDVPGIVRANLAGFPAFLTAPMGGPVSLTVLPISLLEAFVAQAADLERAGGEYPAIADLRRIINGIRKIGDMLP